ncbi:hypothetical protein AAHC03_012980 [Spirometra sp. Aus1]
MLYELSKADTNCGTGLLDVAAMTLTQSQCQTAPPPRRYYHVTSHSDRRTRQRPPSAPCSGNNTGYLRVAVYTEENLQDIYRTLFSPSDLIWWQDGVKDAGDERGCSG